MDDKLATTRSRSDWRSSVLESPRSSNLPAVSSAPSSPATERIERLLRQYKASSQESLIKNLLNVRFFSPALCNVQVARGA